MAILNLNPVLETDEEKLEFIDEITKKAGSVQKQVLTEIMSQNVETDYLQQYGIDGATNRDTFKAKIPVVTYEDIQPYIERIANGDRSKILSAEPISQLFISSGTSSAKMKLIPTTKNDMGRRFLFLGLAGAIASHYVPGLNEGKCLEFIILQSQRESAGGVPIASVTTSMDKSFLSHILIRNTCPSPDVVLCNDYYQSMYIQMLAGLYQRLQVVQIKSVFSYSLILSINFLRDNWPQMVRDITTGILTDKISDQTLRRSISNFLEKPDPDLADFIANQCSSSKDWYGIMAKIWPNTKCLRTIVTGSMSRYLPMLNFYSGGLPIVSLKYACSESYLGINLQPMCDPFEVSYTLLPNMAYFEFMPQEPEKGSSELVDLTNVEMGKEYELVVTTYAGLYRCQVGDILQVTGFHNAAPTFRFVRRKGLLLDICTEMTTEEALQKAVQDATELLRCYGVIVQDYTSHVDVITTPGHYVIYLELMMREEGWGLPDADVLGKCCFVMEEAFNKGYKYFRVSGRIGPLEIRVVSDGTFKKLMDYAVSGGAAINQYKVPRCVKLPHILELLNSQVISAHFSQACPHWSPQQSV